MIKIKIAMPVLNKSMIKKETINSILSVINSGIYDFMDSPYYWHGVFIDENRNALVNDNKSDAQYQSISAEWDKILFWDSDVVANINDVRNLVEADKPIIASLYKARNGGYSGGKFSIDGVVNLSKYNGRLIELPWVSAGFLLNDKSVFNKIEYPFFDRYMFKRKVGNKIFQRRLGEDISFCLNAKRNGYKIYVKGTVEHLL